MVIWRLSHLKKTHGGSLWARAGHRALTDVSLEVSAGERVALVGASGSGKSTLARVGLGLVPPDSGTVHLFGEDATKWSTGRWRVARRHAQLLFQDPRSMLHPGLSLGAILRESARLHQPQADARLLTEDVLDAVGLGGRN